MQVLVAPTEWNFLVLDCIFLCIYVLEALLKIIAQGVEYFYDGWNNLGGLVGAGGALNGGGGETEDKRGAGMGR